MAQIQWTGGANDGNWSTGTNWSGGSAPVTGDDVRIESGSQNITSGLSQGSVNLASLRISFGGTIGSSSTPLTIGCNSGTVTWVGTGSFCKITAGTGGIAKLKVNPNGNGTMYVSGGTVTQLELGRTGLCEIDAAATVTTLYANGMGVNAAAGTGFTTVYNSRSQMTSSRSVTTLETGPGATTTTLDSAAITTSTVQPAGYLNHRSSGTITTSNVRTDGKANAYGSTYAFTVTNRTNFVGYTMNFDKDEKTSITFTNDATAIVSEA